MNKQIEEMAKVIEEASCGYGVDGCHSCEFDGTEDFSCAEMRIAIALYNAGYRKASDVAKEIFAEIDKISLLMDYPYVKSKSVKVALYKDIAELKKKYESEGAE